MKLHWPGGSCNLSACFFDIYSHSSGRKCIFVGLFDQFLLGGKEDRQKEKDVWNLHDLQMNVKCSFWAGGTMLAMAKASSYFIHVHNTEALCLKNWYSLNAVRFCLFVFSVSQEILKEWNSQTWSCFRIRTLPTSILLKASQQNWLTAYCLIQTDLACLWFD